MKQLAKAWLIIFSIVAGGMGAWLQYEAFNVRCNYVGRLLLEKGP